MVVPANADHRMIYQEYDCSILFSDLWLVPCSYFSHIFAQPKLKVLATTILSDSENLESTRSNATLRHHRPSNTLFVPTSRQTFQPIQHDRTTPSLFRSKPLPFFYVTVPRQPPCLTFTLGSVLDYRDTARAHLQYYVCINIWGICLRKTNYR